MLMLWTSACGPQSGVRPANLCQERKNGEEQWKTDDFVEAGNDYVNLAVESASTDQSAYLLVYARDCFAQALRLRPDRYEAHLGLGIVFLDLHKRQFGAVGDVHVSSLKESRYLVQARSYLAKAYMQRRGSFTALYYLAEVAFFAGRRDLAKVFAEELIKADRMTAPAHLLLGAIARLSGQSHAATEHYQAAMNIGIPTSTAEAAGRALGCWNEVCPVK